LEGQFGKISGATFDPCPEKETNRKAYTYGARGVGANASARVLPRRRPPAAQGCSPPISLAWATRAGRGPGRVFCASRGALRGSFLLTRFMSPTNLRIRVRIRVRFWLAVFCRRAQRRQPLGRGLIVLLCDLIRRNQDSCRRTSLQECPPLLCLGTILAR
jgi:hypothetical protein